MTIEPNNVAVIIGVDSPIGLTVMRELGERGVHIVAAGRDAHSIGRASRHCDHFVKIDGPLDRWLPALVREHGAGAVLAISEGDLVDLAELKGKLPGCAVLCPDPDQLRKVLDKRATLAFAADLGMSVPVSWQPLQGEDLVQVAAGIAYPVAVKWADPAEIAPTLEIHGIALEKVEYADNSSELLAILSKYSAIGTYPLVQSWCPGYGLCQMFYMHDGQATQRFQHRRIREWPPTGGVSSFCTSVPLSLHADQMRLSETLLRAIGWSGPAMVEYRYDPATGLYWLMEINGRFWGSLPLAYHSGVHFAWESYSRGIGREGTGAQRPYRKRSARYAIPDAKHMVAVVRGGGSPMSRRLAAAWKFIADYFNPRVRYYVWSLRDPGPFLGDIYRIFRKALRLGRRPPAR